MHQTKELVRNIPDDLDNLLLAYFQREMPHPWPAFTPSVTGAHSSTILKLKLTKAGRPHKRRGYWQGRLALAASIALLLGGTLLFPSGLPMGLPDVAPSIRLSGGDATSKPFTKPGEPLEPPELDGPAVELKR